ncbi:unnamed protein product [Rotaria magnacalcarata]|uniref:ATP-dependent DNA helicase n=2 Tax=Rotaria magnacalcarata TaxID=392030 RepID=A0A816X0T2_9BILA|nr:unnamed protein product [Rotaria magnacalcarata]
MRHFDAETAEAMVFYDIEAMLAEQGRSFSDFGIPIPSVFCPLQSKNINKEEELRFGQKMYETLNEAQRLAVDKILGTHHGRSATTVSCFFIDGPGGTGKTYLYNTLCHLFKGPGVSVLTVAWTGIAPNLLAEGRTLGNGEVPANENDEIDLPTGCISNGNLADEIFGKYISLEDVPNLCDRVILCPKNEHSLIVNEQILQRLPGIEKVYSSVDDIECEDGEDVCNYPTEFLNSLTPSWMPHKLNLKAGAIVMLLRNLDMNRGLCNSSRPIVRHLHNHTVDCDVAT